MVKKSTIIAYLILLFPIMHLAASTMNGAIATAFSYYDELIGSLSMIYVTILVFRRKLNKADGTIYLIMVVLTIIGLLSNVFSGLLSEIFPILIDVVFLWKPIACYLAFKHYAVKYRDNMLQTLYPWAKACVVFNLLISLTGQVFNLGVTRGAFLAGLKEYSFFWDSTYQTAWLIIGSLLIIAANCTREQTFWGYFLLSVIPLFLIGAIMAWGWLLLVCLLMLMAKRNIRITKIHIVVFAVMMVAIFREELSYYLLSDNAPRAKLLRGALTVANTFFPLGSGFATYGSEMAFRYYSQIYIAFGWENSWGLGRVYYQYVNDNFFACIIGQFGWIGFLLYLFMLLKIFNSVNSRQLSQIERVTAVSTILTIVASMLGSATAKSAMGVCIFAIIGVLAAKPERQRIQQLQNRETQI